MDPTLRRCPRCGALLRLHLINLTKGCCVQCQGIRIPGKALRRKPKPKVAPKKKPAKDDKPKERRRRRDLGFPSDHPEYKRRYRVVAKAEKELVKLGVLSTKTQRQIAELGINLDPDTFSTQPRMIDYDNPTVRKLWRLFRGAPKFEGPPPMLQCSCCGELKPTHPSNFARSEKNRWGYSARCRQCLNQARRQKRLETGYVPPTRNQSPQQRAKAARYHAEWQASNIAKVRGYQTTYRQKQKESPTTPPADA